MPSSTPAHIDETLIARVRDRILEACTPQAILLFGSAARDETRPGSDLDLLVILDVAAGTTARNKPGAPFISRATAVTLFAEPGYTTAN